MRAIQIILALIVLVGVPVALLTIAGIVASAEGWVAGLVFLVLATLMVVMFGGIVMLIVDLVRRILCR